MRWGWSLLLLGLGLSLAGSRVSAQEESPRRELAKAKLEERQVLRELNVIEQDLNEIELELDQLRDRSDSIERERRVHEDALVASEVLLDERTSVLRRRINSLYRLNRQGFARVIFSADDPGEIRRRSRYLMAVVQETRLSIQRYLDQVVVRADLLEQVDLDREGLDAVQTELRLKESELRSQRAQRTLLLEEIRGRRDLALQALAERSSRGTRLVTELEDSWTQQPSASVSFRKLRGKLQWPVRGTVIRYFDRYRDPETGESLQSQGIDIRAPLYTPIRAVADGTVQFVNFIPGYGLTMVLQHDSSHTTVYSHAAKVHVASGQRVRAGEAIGLVGETGLTDDNGPRLHFEVRYHQQPQDPLPWLGKGY